MPSTFIICKRVSSRSSSSLSCSSCFSCFHSSCLDISTETFRIYNKPRSNWTCPKHSIQMPTSPKATAHPTSDKSNKKPLTLDDLAGLIKSFSSNQDKNFASINSRIDDINAHLSKLNFALDLCLNKIDSLENRVSVLETQYSSTNTESIKFYLC